MVCVALSFVCLLAACENKTSTTPPETKVTPSETARIKFKGVTRLVNNLSQALSLPKDQLCKELGTFNCFTQAHEITLGGVEPYVKRINEKWHMPPLSAPITVDRVALASCAERVKRDFADASQALIFKALVSGDTSASAREKAVIALYQRLLLREPTKAQADAWVGFFDKVKEKSKKPSQDWATLVCFGVVSSTEFLFY